MYLSLISLSFLFVTHTDKRFGETLWFQDLSMCAPNPEGNQACKHDYNQSQWTPKPVPDNQKRRK